MTPARHIFWVPPSVFCSESVFFLQCVSDTGTAPFCFGVSGLPGFGGDLSESRAV